jgi:hypothetical protein
MPILQDNVLGQDYLTVVEKLSGEDHSLLMHLSYDVVLARLVKQIAMEFQAGEGYSKVPTGSDVDPTGHTEALTPILAAPRAYVLKASGGGALDQGLTLHENSVLPDATVELHLRA